MTHGGVKTRAYGLIVCVCKITFEYLGITLVEYIEIILINLLFTLAIIEEYKVDR